MQGKELNIENIVAFSNWAVIKFILLGFVIWLILRFLKYIIPVLIKRKESKRYVRKYLPSLELLIWFLFLTFSIEYFLNTYELIGYGLFVLIFIFIVWFSFIVFKNIIAGVVFKISDHFSINDTLKVGKYSGRIINFGISNLELETESGKSIFIPYSKILDRVNIKTDPAEKISRYSFKLETGKELNLSEKTEQIKQAIMVLPWTSIKKIPVIKPIDESEKAFFFEITVFSLEKEYFYKIENNIKEQFQRIKN